MRTIINHTLNHFPGEGGDKSLLSPSLKEIMHTELTQHLGSNNIQRKDMVEDKGGFYIYYISPNREYISS